MEKWFAGMDGFLWFMGVVESRQDPLGLGRVKVRAFGIHSPNLSDIPTDALPWASMSHGVNTRNHFEAPHESDVVWGFFADGRNCQVPIIVGVVPGFWSKPADPNKGFNDVRPAATLKYSPRKPKNLTYKTDGSGVAITEIDLTSSAALGELRHPQPDELDDESVPQVATGQDLANTVIQYRKTNLDKQVPIAGGGNWSEPYPAFNPLYPYNNATETESGHLLELDDTPGSERVHLAHRNGSFIEMYPSGTRVEKVTKSRYAITMGDDHVHIMGRCLITVSGDANIKVVGATTLETNKLSVNSAGDMDVSVGGALNFKAASMSMDIAGDINEQAGGNFNRQAGGGVNEQAGGQWLTGGSYASITAGLIQLNGSTTAQQGGVPPGPTSVPGIPGAIGSGSPNEASVPNETAPVPLPSSLIKFDPETGLAFKYQQFNPIDPTTNKPTQPVQDVTPSGPCGFDPNSHTFIPSSQWNISQKGLGFIQAREGFGQAAGNGLVKPYPDPTPDSLAIGYGTHGPVIDTVITPDLRWTQAQAVANLQYALNTHFIPTLVSSVNIPLTQNMVDALLSLMFNVGQTNFTGSTLVTKLNANDICGAADQFLVWNKTNHGLTVDAGLTTRRKLERTVFLT